MAGKSSDDQLQNTSVHVHEAEDQPGPSPVLKKARYHGVRQMLSCRVVQQPGQRVFNALTEEGLNAYIVETIYRHWEESNTLFFGIVCPKQVSLEPAKNVKHALARVYSYLRTKPEETKIVLRDLLFVSIPNLTQQQLEEDLDDTPDNFFEYDDHPEVPTLLNRQPYPLAKHGACYVEAIIGHKINNGNLFFEVSWFAQCVKMPMAVLADYSALVRGYINTFQAGAL